MPCQSDAVLCMLLPCIIALMSIQSDILCEIDFTVIIATAYRQLSTDKPIVVDSGRCIIVAKWKTVSGV